MLTKTDIISRNAKAAREANGFSQANVAGALGIDQSYVSKFESGERPMQASMVEHMAYLYGYKVSELEDEAGIPNQAIKSAYRASNLTSADMRVIHDIRRIGMNLLLMSELSSGIECER
jgi:transcriptional regulator with XRE-family HTH domain